MKTTKAYVELRKLAKGIGTLSPEKRKKFIMEIIDALAEVSVKSKGKTDYEAALSQKLYETRLLIALFPDFKRHIPPFVFQEFEVRYRRDDFIQPFLT